MADAGQESSEGISVSKPVARVMMLVNAAVWGSGYTMLKHVQENMPTQWMMFFRMASAVLLMAIVFFPRLRRIRLRRYIVPGLILALTYWLGFIFQLKGLETTSPGRNSFFTDTYCVMVPFVVWAFTRKTPQLAASGGRVRLRVRHWSGVAERRRWRGTHAYELR